MGVTRQFAEVIVRGSAGRATERSSSFVRRSVLDWIGCAISGSMSEAARLGGAYAQQFGAGGDIQVIGTGLRRDAGIAAWVNGVQGHVDDYDDSGSHPSSYLTPTVLALGQALGAPGARVLEAWAIGYEVATTLGDGIHPDRGWHTTSLYGTVGAAAAAALLLELGVDETEHALGIAASQTGGLMRNFGSMTKATHPANAARAGIEAARLAALGFEASSGIVESRYGLVDNFGGAKAHVPAIAPQREGPLRVERQPPVIKAWPTCTGTQRSLTAVFDFLAQHPTSPDRIARVDHFGPLIPGEGPLQYSSVTTPLQGKFSLEYTLAAAFVDGRIDHDSFTQERFDRGDLQEFMRRIHRHRAHEATLHSSRTAGAIDVDRLVIELSDGSVHDLKLGPRRTLDGTEVEEKFVQNAGRGRIAADPDAVVAFVNDLERAPSIAPLMSMLASDEALSGGMQA